MMEDIRLLQQNIKRRNFLAIYLVAILVSISFLGLMVLFNQQEKDAEIINLAGSQRMLSQKIALLATQHYHNLQIGIEDRNIQKDLNLNATLFLANQNTLSELSKNGPNAIPEEVYSLYFSAPANINKKIDIYTQSAIKLSQTQDLTLAKNLLNEQFNNTLINELLTQLDTVVNKVERNINQKISYIKMFEAILWLVTISLLIAISIFIFRPLQKLIIKNYHDLFFAKQQSAELNFAINKHAIVYRISMDKTGTITEVNERFLKFYRYSEDEIIGQSVFNICSQHYQLKEYKEVFKACVSNEYWHGESINKIKGGRELWLNTTIVPMTNNQDKIESFIVIQNDISGIKQTELALNHLHQITSNIDKNLPEKIQAILVLGKQIFNLPLALISEVNAQEYAVLYCNTPNDEINPGDKFELGNTYCLHTLNADKPTSFHHAGTSKIKNHPCYLNFGLESYIGVPIIVDGNRFGTLNFSGPEPSSRPFTNRELDLIQLFAHWISAELTRDNHQNKLLQQQSLMEQMGQQARIGAWEVNLINDSIYWSDMTKEIHEVPSDYLPELSTAINFYKEGDSRETIVSLVEKSIEDGTAYEQELQLVTAKGKERWVSARGRAEFTNGHCVRIFGSIQDITDKMSSQQKITENSQRMTLATDSAGIGIWVLNLITNELAWDDWMFKLYGISPEKFSGAYEAWEKGLHPDDKMRATSELKDAVENNGRLDTQFRIIWPNGEIKHIKAAAIISYDKHKQPISMTGVNYDVTERVENEIALTKAKEQAEIAVTAKNEFFASMSHEIRTPMNGVIGMLDLVKESNLPQEQKHRIGIAQQSAKSLLSLINDILDFSKIDANKLDLENISFNLRKMAGYTAESFAQQAQQKNLEIILDLVDIEEPYVKGDSNRVRQILTNLIGNAIKFTKQGEVIVKLSQVEHSDDYWGITLAVSDTGIGIPTDKQKDLFEAFSQVDASTTRQYGGTGLGLAIVKKLSACMHGNIKVESKEGEGSTFICEILIEKSPQSVLPSPTKSLIDKNVLIVDSNQSCGDIIKKQLNAWNINATFLQSSQEALTLLHAQQTPFHLVILNQKMPDLDNLNFVRSIREIPSLSDLKIVVMTMMDDQHNVVDNLKQSPDDYITKPVTTHDLQKALNTLLDKTEQRNDEKSNTHSISPAFDNISMKNVKLLLVEDNRINQMVAMGVLNKIGIEQCIVAENGVTALEQLNASSESDPFTFIFMDCQMPEMDGYEATKLIRDGNAGSRYKNIPIVAMTANAMLGDEEKCLSAGMNDYLVKPIDKEQVLDTLKVFLGTET